MEMDKGNKYECIHLAETYSNLLQPSKREGITSTSTHVFKNEPIGFHWEELPSMIYKRVRFTSVIHEKKLYVFGGNCFSSDEHGSNGRRSNSAEMFNPETNCWVKLPNMLERRVTCSCAVIGDKIYVTGGGGSKTGSRSSEVFDTRTKSWSALPLMKYRKDKHSSIAIGENLYVFGGYRGKRMTEVFNTLTGKWSMMSRMNEERYSFATVAIENKIFAIGGKKDFPIGMNRPTPQYNRYLETMEVYDIQKDEWKVSKAKMRNRRCGCSAVVIGGTIQVIGGVDEKEVVVTSIESFDLVQQKWSGSFITPSKKARKQFSALMMTREELVVIGGIDESLSLSNLVEKCSIPKDPFKNSFIPNINKFSNIDPNQKDIEFPILAETTKCTKRKHKNTSQINSKAKKEKRLMTEKKRDKVNFTYNNVRVAKLFDDGLFYGSVKKYVEEKKCWSIVYDDGDEEDLDKKELQKAIQLYENEEKNRIMIKKSQQQNIEKAQKQTIQVANNSNSEALNEAQQSQGLMLKSIDLKSLQQIMDAKVNEVSKKEEVEFGKVQGGSLQNRIEKLRQNDEVKNMEIKVFGETQHGDYETRLQNLKVFFDSNSLI